MKRNSTITTPMAEFRAHIRRVITANHISISEDLIIADNVVNFEVAFNGWRYNIRLISQRRGYADSSEAMRDKPKGEN